MFIRTAVLAVFYLLILVCLIPVLLVCVLLGARQPLLTIGRETMRLSRMILGFHLSVEGLDRIDRTRPAVFMSNHASFLDGPLLFLLIPLSLRIIMKKSVFRIPVVGQGMRFVGFVPVDRGGGAKRAGEHRTGGRPDPRPKIFVSHLSGRNANAGWDSAGFPEGRIFSGRPIGSAPHSRFHRRDVRPHAPGAPDSQEGADLRGFSSASADGRDIGRGDPGLNGPCPSDYRIRIEGRASMSEKAIGRELGLLIDGFFAQRKAAIEAAVSVCAAAIGSGRKILAFGNGGSAAEAQHFVAELVNKFLRPRPALRAVALSTDTSVLTSIGNDVSFDAVFSRQVEALGDAGDIALALTTSGNSPNIIAALRTAKSLGLTTIALTGQSGGGAAGITDILLDVPTAETPRIQEIHLVLLHFLAAELDVRLGYSQ